jgi:hypothetical protein
VPYARHWKLFLDYLMTSRVLKVLCNLQLDGVFHMGQDWDHIYTKAKKRLIEHFLNTHWTPP